MQRPLPCCPSLSPLQLGGVAKLGLTVVATFAVVWLPWVSASPQAVLQVRGHGSKVWMWVAGRGCWLRARGRTIMDEGGSCSQLELRGEVCLFTGGAGVAAQLVLCVATPLPAAGKAARARRCCTPRLLRRFGCCKPAVQAPLPRKPYMVTWSLPCVLPMRRCWPASSP